MSAYVVIEVLKDLAWLGESFPDNPRLGRKLLLGGGALLTTIFAPENFRNLGDAILVVKGLCVITGIVCIVLGIFVFFRRWVWRRQDKRTPRIISLGISGRHSDRRFSENESDNGMFEVNGNLR